MTTDGNELGKFEYYASTQIWDMGYMVLELKYHGLELNSCYFDVNVLHILKICQYDNQFCFIRVRNLVFQIKERTEAEGIWEVGARSM